MGHFGFSYIGLLYLLMLYIPNGLWAKNKPIGYSPVGENKVLLILERTGQVLSTVSILLFKDYEPKSFEIWILWFIASFILMLLYVVNWIRYFRSERTVKDFYSSILGIPVPGATLPVLAFLLLGIYGKVIWLGISSIVLGIGHIGIHINHSIDIDNEY